MLVASLCSLPVGVLRWRGPTPRITVIVKATYAIARDGAAELLADQPPLSLDVPDPHGSPSALWYASDFAPRKARADVTLVGGAFAEEASALIPVHLRIEGLERRLVARAGVPSTYIPLSEGYLHASLARNAATLSVGPRSLAARAMGGAASLDAWGLPAGPLDAAFDFATFNAAAPEQQIGSLSTGTSITLVGTVRDGERRTVVLPGHRPRAFHAGKSGPGATPDEIALKADTLWIDSYGGACALVWRGEIDLGALPERPHEILVALEQGSARWSWPDLCAAFASARRERAIEPADLGAITSEPPEEPEPAALDDELVDVGDDELFTARDVDEDDAMPTGRPPPIEIDDEPTPAPAASASAKHVEETTGLVDLAQLRGQSALPFGEEPRRAPPKEESTGMIDLAQLRASKTLPFPQQRATIAATDIEPDRPAPDLSATPFGRPRRRNDPLIQTATVDDRPRALVPATPFERFAPTPPRDDAPPRPARTDALPFSAPPAVIAPAMVPPAETAPRFVPEQRFTPSPVIAVAPPVTDAAAQHKTPLLPLETYATIKAELWRRSPLALPAVTAEHGLTEVEWLTHDLRYREAIDAQAKEGTSVIAASVARAMAAAKRARASGDDLDLAGYLALKSEIEAAGDADGALKKRGLTRRALRRIERRWQPQLQRDPEGSGLR